MKRRKKSHYYIEIRYFGKAKRNIKKLISEIDTKFNLKKARKIPHITVIQPFTTKNQKKVVSDFKKVCSKYPLMKFTVDGFGSFPFFVNFLKIKPDKKIINFRKDLMYKLQKYCFIHDFDRSYKPHTTLALRPGFFNFLGIWLHTKLKPKPVFTNHTIRITLLKGQKILYEYDFLSRRLLNRRQAKSRKQLSNTFSKLKQRKQ